MIIFLIDFLTIIIPAVITLLLYFIYFKLFIMGYVNEIANAISAGDDDRALRMRATALKKQPKRMKKLFIKYGIQFNE